MGSCVSQTPEEREAKSRSSAIDRNLRQDAKEFENTIKILLLGMSFELFMNSVMFAVITGAGESGKSTLVKQMKIIHGDGYKVNELNSFKVNYCYNNNYCKPVRFPNRVLSTAIC